MIFEYRQGDFLISTDPGLLDIEAIHSFLTHSYWAQGVPQDLVAKSIENSLNFGVFDQTQQIGYANVVTDFTHFAYVQNVFVLEAYQGNGIGRWLMECIVASLQSQGIRRIILVTKDAQLFYQKCGFESLSNQDGWLEILVESPWSKLERSGD